MDGRQNKRLKPTKEATSRKPHEAVQSHRNRDNGEVSTPMITPKTLQHDRVKKKSNRTSLTLQHLPMDASGAESSRNPAHAKNFQHELESTLIAAEKAEHITRPKKYSKKRKAAIPISTIQDREEGDEQAEGEDGFRSIAKVDQDESAVTSQMAAAQVKALQLENARLQEEIEKKDAIMSIQRNTISYFYGQCTCTICMELVWRPHVLSPCGHVFCARCLVAWFTKPSVNEPPLPSDLDGNLREIQRQRTLKRVKVCPHCRENVLVAPVEVWLVKGLIEQIDESMRGGQGNDEHIVQGNESFQGLSLEEQQEAKGLNLPVSKKIWKDIFKEKPTTEPMFDEEDRVYRCVLCANEVVDGSCIHCGLVYDVEGMATGSDLLEDEDYSVDSMAEMDEEDMEFLDDEVFSHLGRHLPHHHHDAEDYEDSELSEIERHYDQMLGEGYPVHVSASDGSISGESQSIGRNHDDDDDDGVQEVDPQGRPVSARRIRYVISDSEGEDEPHNTVSHITIDASDEEDEEIYGSDSQNGSSLHNEDQDGVSSSDEIDINEQFAHPEDEEDEEEDDDDEEDDEDDYEEGY